MWHQFLVYSIGDFFRSETDARIGIGPIPAIEGNRAYTSGIVLAAARANNDASAAGINDKTTNCKRLFRGRGNSSRE